MILKHFKFTFIPSFKVTLLANNSTKQYNNNYKITRLVSKGYQKHKQNIILTKYKISIGDQSRSGVSLKK